MPVSSSSVATTEWSLRAESFSLISNAVSNSFLHTTLGSPQFTPASAAAAVQLHLSLLSAIAGALETGKQNAKMIANTALQQVYPAVVSLLSMYLADPTTSDELLHFILISFKSFRKEIDISFVVQTIQYVVLLLYSSLPPPPSSLFIPSNHQKILTKLSLSLSLSLSLARLSLCVCLYLAGPLWQYSTVTNYMRFYHEPINTNCVY
jgi:hypothetical protein